MIKTRAYLYGHETGQDALAVLDIVAWTVVQREPQTLPVAQKTSSETQSVCLF
jgi:hypothetical protein